MLRARLALPALVLALLGGAAVGARAAAPTFEPTVVGCDRIVLRSRAGAEDGFRVLLGTVAVPGSRHLAGAAKVAGGPWPYFRNAGLVVRGGASAVTVTVPEGWRDRVALSWGESPLASSISFAACAGTPAKTWNAYSGGFHLRSSSDCVPLSIRVGGMSTTVRVGVGRRCGADG